MLLYLLRTCASSGNLLHNVKLFVVVWGGQGGGTLHVVHLEALLTSPGVSSGKQSCLSWVRGNQCSLGSEREMRAGGAARGKHLQKEQGCKSCSSALPCPLSLPQANPPHRVTALCLHRLCQPEGTRHGDPEEPGRPCQSPGADPVSYR